MPELGFTHEMSNSVHAPSNAEATSPGRASSEAKSTKVSNVANLKLHLSVVVGAGGFRAKIVPALANNGMVSKGAGQDRNSPLDSICL